jgi:hypothetical protein
MCDWPRLTLNFDARQCNNKAIVGYVVKNYVGVNSVSMRCGTHILNGLKECEITLEEAVILEIMNS